MNVGALTARLNSFSGFDLTDSEALDLLNEAAGRFALRSKYPRKVADIGPTVAAQVAYDWPTDLLLPLSLSIDGEPWEVSDPETVKQYAKGELVLQRNGVWCEEADAEGNRKLQLYPAPSGGSTIELEWVYEPAPMTAATDEPSWLPGPFHTALLPEASSYYYETVEDNPELAQRNSEKADLRVAELTHYDNMRRSGNGVFQIGIQGVTA